MDLAIGKVRRCVHRRIRTTSDKKVRLCAVSYRHVRNASTSVASEPCGERSEPPCTRSKGKRADRRRSEPALPRVSATAAAA